MLTSKKFHDIVVSKNFCIEHIGRKPDQGISLRMSLPNFYQPTIWVPLLADYHNMWLVNMISKRSQIHVTGPTRNKTSKQLLTSGIMVLQLLQLLMHSLKAPSFRSQHFMSNALENIIPDAMIMLLRWTFYTIWIFLDTSILEKKRPLGDGIYEHYGKLFISNLVGPSPLIDTGGQTLGGNVSPARHLPWRASRTLLMIECTLLYGPTHESMRHMLTEGAGAANRLSGPLYWFIRDSMTEIFSNRFSGSRWLANGIPISFREFGTTFDRRFDSMETTLGLEACAAHTKDSIVDVVRRNIREACAPLADMLQEVDFADVGRQLCDSADEYRTKPILHKNGSRIGYFA